MNWWKIIHTHHDHTRNYIYIALVSMLFVHYYAHKYQINIQFIQQAVYSAITTEEVPIVTTTTTTTEPPKPPNNQQ